MAPEIQIIDKSHDKTVLRLGHKRRFVHSKTNWLVLFSSPRLDTEGDRSARAASMGSRESPHTMPRNELRCIRFLPIDRDETLAR